MPHEMQIKVGFSNVYRGQNTSLFENHYFIIEAV